MRHFPEILSIALCLALFAVLTGCTQLRTPLKPEEAAEAAQALVLDPEMLGITNFREPEVEQLTVGEEHTVLSVAENGRDKNGDPKPVELRGKTVYRVTFHTENEAAKGPITLYIDARSGQVYGMDARG